MHLRLLAASLLLLPLLAGCATKRDLRDLRTEMEAMRESQAEMLREVQRQNVAIMDSINDQGTRLRGDFSNQLVGIERQLVQIQELTGQGQQRLSELREQLRSREQVAASAAVAGPSASTAPPEDLFNASLAALRRGSMATARTGFEEFLRNYAQHPLAAEAQFHIGETYGEANEADRALAAFARVIELYPASARAPTALLRSGQIEVARGDRDAARTSFTRIVAAYPNSPEAPLATEQISALGRG